MKRTQEGERYLKFGFIESPENLKVVPVGKRKLPLFRQPFEVSHTMRQPHEGEPSTLTVTAWTSQGARTAVENKVNGAFSRQRSTSR